MVDSDDIVAAEEDATTTTTNHSTTTMEESNKIMDGSSDDSQTFDVVRDDNEEEQIDNDQRLSELKIESTNNVGRSDDESQLSNDRTASPQLLNDDELKMFEHLAQLDYETEKKEQATTSSINHNESFGNSSANLDESVEQPLIHSQISVSNTVESEEYTITTNYTITTTHPFSSVNINTSVISESSSTDDLEIQENKVEIPVEVSLSPRQIGKSIIPGLSALRGSTMLPNPPIDEHQQIHDDEYDDFHEISLGNDGTPQKKGKKKQDSSDVNESFDYECNVWCFAQPLSYLFIQLFSNNDSNYSNDNEVEMKNVNNTQIEA
ncbi:predicted protein [Naegleria gruberi]|uniref:Predicted protein n=1 Tax=Naegleria gruberi TaxID=5762 RepID=D2VK48_NAEGR|nr:uncharacterized protein NAEGRDRAFT_69268 [Naegleria gruberi]EFC42884.1 predicted protein [Naegleria gruberi]|eukprot:XP_002675628.1 predicted protein [Naegleria gruberi strain NEG-M]